MKKETKNSAKNARRTDGTTKPWPGSVDGLLINRHGRKAPKTKATDEGNDKPRSAAAKDYCGVLNHGLMPQIRSVRAARKKRGKNTGKKTVHSYCGNR